jgi:ABC-type multidrug transport system permease subunit
MIPARLKSAYFYGSIVRALLVCVVVAGFASYITHDSFWDVLATITFVVVFLEVLKIPAVYRRLAKIRTGLGLKGQPPVNQSSPESMER